jgi:hypothetical protein
MRGIGLGFVFDVRFVPHAPQPQLGLFVRLAGADRFHRLAALEIVAVIEAAVAEHLGDVPAELRLEGLADLAILELPDRLLELRGEGARPRPAKSSPLRTRWRNASSLPRTVASSASSVGFIRM